MNLFKLNDTFDLYFAPILFFVIGFVFLFGTLFGKRIKHESEVIRIEGHLKSFYFQKSGRGKSNYRTILTLHEYENEFSDPFLNKMETKKYFDTNSVAISFYIPRIDLKKLNVDEQINVYGMTINGFEYLTLENAIKREHFFADIALPIMSLGFILFGFILNFKTAKKLKKHSIIKVFANKFINLNLHLGR